MQTSVDKLREHYSDEKTNNEESNNEESNNEESNNSIKSNKSESSNSMDLVAQFNYPSLSDDHLNIKISNKKEFIGLLMKNIRLALLVFLLVFILKVILNPSLKLIQSFHHLLVRCIRLVVLLQR